LRGARLSTLLRGVELTVLVFDAQECGVLSAHTARLRALSEEFIPRGVQFWAVERERGGERLFWMPRVRDPRGDLARATGAAYAGETLVLTQDARIRYRGGIDSNGLHLTEDARPYLREALEDLLAGRPLRFPETKTLGCALP
jgi:hypothetical protein